MGGRVEVGKLALRNYLHVLNDSIEEKSMNLESSFYTAHDTT